MEQAFADLKTGLTTAPCLAHPDLDRPFVLQTDASNNATGAVLLQEQLEGTVRPVGYFSKKLPPSQKNYITHQKECLDIGEGVGHFRGYLLDRPFVGRSDNQAVKWLYKCDPKNPMLAAWLAKLQEYPMEVEYIRGSENTITDLLSRIVFRAVTRPQNSLNG